MPGYRLFCRRENGRIFRSEEIVADDDESAVAQAHELCGGFSAELWSDKRLVKEIPASGASPD